VQWTPRRDAIARERVTRHGLVRVALVLVTVAAVAAALCGVVEAAVSASPFPSPSTAVVAVPHVRIPSVSAPSVPIPVVPSAPAPGVPVPPVPVPSTPTPSVPAPSAPTPPVPAPSVPTPAVQGAPAAGSGARPATSSPPSDSASPRSLPQDAGATIRGRGAPSRAGSRVRRAGGAGSRAAIPAIGTSPQAVRRALRELGGCVSSLSTEARSLLRQRAGAGRAGPRSLAALSVGLGISRAAVIGRLRRAIGELRAVARTTRCAGTSIPANLLQTGSTLLGNEGDAPTAGRSAVRGVSAHGGPSPQRGSAPGSEAAPPPAAGGAGPRDELLIALLLLMLAILGVGGLASRRVGPSRKPRRRRTVTPRLYSLARRAGFRYSRPRDALVLRGIGERFGPVLVRERIALPQPGRDRAGVSASGRASGNEREGHQARRRAGRRP